MKPVVYGCPPPASVVTSAALAYGAREGERPLVALGEGEGLRDLRAVMLAVGEGETGERVRVCVRVGVAVTLGERELDAVTLGERELDGTVADTLAANRARAAAEERLRRLTQP